MEFKELETELNIVGAFMANILIAEIVAKGKVASGNLRDSVEYVIARTENSYQVDLLADRYINNVSDGRKAGYPNGGDGSFLKALIEWVKIKSIESDDKKAKAAAWAIREAIFKRGIPATNIIEFAIEQIDRQIDEMVTAAIDRDIKNHFNEMFNKLG
jgi:hypothetical protein